MQKWLEMECSVFVYGSLLFCEVWEKLIGRKPKIHLSHVLGFRRYCVYGEFYPGMWFSNGEVVYGGHVCISSAEQAKIQEYEGLEYIQTSVLVCIDNQSIPMSTFLRPPQNNLEWIHTWNEELLSAHKDEFFRSI